MESTQHHALRKVLGAYKATPTRQLELEAFCPPLDIYFNKRLADFEDRLRHTGMGDLIQQSCATIAAQLRNRRGRPQRVTRLTGHDGWAQWAQDWTRHYTASETRERDKTTTKAAQHQWRQRWHAGTGHDRGMPAIPDAFEGGHLHLHKNLPKAQSSLLVQARTGKIGLRQFLFRRHVPSVATPVCPCGNGDQTIEHLFTVCTDPRSTKLRAFDMHSYEEVANGLSEVKAGIAASMAKALLQSGWFNDFRVARALHNAEALEASAGWTYRPPPMRDRARKARRRARRPAL